MTLWRLLPLQARIGVIVILMGVIIVSYAITFYSGAQWKQRRMENKVLVKTVTIAEKRNEIANNRPDDAAFFNGLLNDSDW